VTIYTSGTVGANTATLEDFPSSQGAALGASVESAWQSNPSIVALDANNLYEANTGKSLLGPAAELAAGIGQMSPFNIRSGAIDLYERLKAPDTVPKLDKAAAEKVAQEAGAKLSIPDEGMSQAALDLLIKRQLNNRRIDDTLARAPAGLLNGSTRFLAQLATSLVDPLSVASAFVPVVGEARYGQMLAQAGGIFGRTAVRAGVGALEGAVGAALLEPAIYAGRTQLQDDYSMADSLENLAFGAAFGGGLHAIGGGIADAFRRAGGQPFERIAANEASIAPSPVESPAAPGLSDEAFAISRRIDSGTLSVEQFSKLYQENPELAREVIAFRAGDTAKLGEAPFDKGLSLEAARTQAIQELTPEIKAQLIADAGNTAERGAIAALKSQQASIEKELARLQDEPDAVFRETAKDLQGQGLSRKKAEAEARKQLADREANLVSQNDALSQQITSNAKAEQATQAILGLEKGKIPDAYQPMVDARAQELLGKSQLQQAVALPPEASARFAVSRVSPDVRRSALSSAVAQMAEGKIPDVESIIKLDPNDPNSIGRVTETARRSVQPEASATADFAAAQSAADRLKVAPKSAGLVEADGELIKAMDRLNATQKNLEQAGLSHADFMKELQPFDDALKTADEYGNAVRAAALCGIRS